MSSIGAINSSTEVYGGPAQSKALVEATLYEIAKQKAINDAPLKVPDARELYAPGRGIDLTI